MARVLEIVMKARNEIGPAVQSAQSDIKRLRESVGDAASWGAALFAARTAIGGLAAAAKAARGDFGDMWETLGRIPFFGPLIRDMKDFWDTVRGVKEEQERAAEAAAKHAAATKALAESMDFVANARRDTLSQAEEAAEKARDSFAKTKAEIEARHQPTLDHINAGEWGPALLPEIYRQEMAEAEGQRDRAIKRALDKEREDTTAALIKRLDTEHKLEVEAFEKRVREKHDIAKREQDDYLALLRQRQEEEDRESAIGFSDFIGSLRKTDPGKGSTGTISTADVTSRFMGLGADAQAEANRRHAEQVRIVKETNEKLDALIKLNEQSGGALERFFGNGGGLN